jgi:imidazolonepropionase-like amidohydrolase
MSDELAASANGTQQTAIRIDDVAVVDVISGTIRSHQSVDVVGETIVWLGDATDAHDPSPGCTIISGGGLTLVPGMIDCHVHLAHDGEANWMTRPPRGAAEETLGVVANAIAALRAGTTTLRDCGSGHVRAPLALALHPPVNVTLPTVVSCGTPITMTGGHLHWEANEADGVDGVRRAVRAELKAGAQWIKVIATGGVLTPGTDVGSESFTREELAAAVAEARRGGRRVAAHAIGKSGIDNALAAGVSTVEHGSYLGDEAIDLMLEKGAFHVPTLSAYHQVVSRGMDGGVPAESIAKALSAHETNLESFRKSLAAGVPVVAGTDAGTPHNFHGEVAFELQLMVSAGATPQQALRTATVNAAAALDLSDKIGDVALGKWADLVLVDGDPLEDIAHLSRPVVVIKRGEIVFRRSSEVLETSSVPTAVGVA